MLIGLTGRARSGKDTVFEFIQNELPYAKREAFADRLKVSAARALGFDGTPEACVEFCNYIKGNRMEVITDCDGYDGHEDARFFLRITGREYLQRYGTEAHREVFDVDFWVNAVLPMDINHTEDLIVVTDVRFDNEAQRVRDLKGEVWQITRPGLEIEESAHASEVPVDPKLVEKVIVNDGTLEDLRSEVISALSLFAGEVR